MLPVFDGYVYMSRLDADTEVLGCVVRRMWWKPWRWSVQPLYYTRPSAPGAIIGSREGEPIHNLTKLGVAGMLKLYGIDRDFSDFLGEPK